MIEELNRYGISAERKSIYDDLEALRVYGLDIECTKTKTTGYHVLNRDYELAELKLLVDSVQASKFITLKKSMQLIKKIEGMCSVHEAKSLQRQVYITNRIKSINEGIYYNIDQIHMAIAGNKKISYRYFEYIVTKERKFRRNGERYRISPYALTWDDENYYLLGYDHDFDLTKHFRVDKMTDIEILGEKRDHQEQFADLDMALYAKKVFAMFSGEEENVRLELANKLIGVAIDRFGKEVSVRECDEEHFIIDVWVLVSPQFFGWVASFGGDTRIVAPQHVVEKMKEHIQTVVGRY